MPQRVLIVPTHYHFPKNINSSTKAVAAGNNEPPEATQTIQAITSAVIVAALK